MYTFNPSRILVPTNFGPAAASALGVGRKLAAQYRAELLLVHAAFMLPLTFDGVTTALSSETSLEHDADHRLRAYADRHLASTGIRYRTITSIEPPVRAIADIAEKEKCDLIVIGTSGRSNLHHLLFGSVAEAVLHRSNTPVLTVRRDERHDVFTCIICPVDYSPDARHALLHAASLARAFGGELIPVQVKPGPKREEDEGRPITEWVRSIIGTDTVCQPVVRHGDTAKEVLHLADTVDASLLVIGAHHAHFFDPSVLGMSAESAVRRAHRPVLVVTGADEAVVDSVVASARGEQRV